MFYSEVKQTAKVFHCDGVSYPWEIETIPKLALADPKVVRTADLTGPKACDALGIFPNGHEDPDALLRRASRLLEMTAELSGYTHENLTQFFQERPTLGVPVRDHSLFNTALKSVLSDLNRDFGCDLSWFPIFPVVFPGEEPLESIRGRTNWYNSKETEATGFVMVCIDVGACGSLARLTDTIRHELKHATRVVADSGAGIRYAGWISYEEAFARPGWTSFGASIKGLIKSVIEPDGFCSLRKARNHFLELQREFGDQAKSVYIRLPHEDLVEHSMRAAQAPETWSQYIIDGARMGYLRHALLAERLGLHWRH